jgi:hypothetical protein
VSAPATARDDRLTPLDRLTLAYGAIPTLALALSFRDGPIRGWPYVLLAHALLAACALLAPRARAAGAVGRVVGDLYPLLLLPALYGEIGIFTLHRGVVHDALIQTLSCPSGRTRPWTGSARRPIPPFVGPALCRLGNGHSRPHRSRSGRWAGVPRRGRWSWA